MSSSNLFCHASKNLRLTIAVLIACVSPMLAEDIPANLRTQNFDHDPGWESFRSR